MRKINLLFILFTVSTALGQNLKSEDLRYNYIKLPTNPLQPRVANYSSSLSSSSDEENAKIVAQYEKDVAQAEADYQREMNEYPNKEEMRTQGTAIFLPSFINHAALPVTKGTRYSLAVWFEGPKFV